VRPTIRECLIFGLGRPAARSSQSLYLADCITFTGAPHDGPYFCALHRRNDAHKAKSAPREASTLGLSRSPPQPPPQQRTRRPEHAKIRFAISILRLKTKRLTWPISEPEQLTPLLEVPSYASVTNFKSLVGAQGLEPWTPFAFKFIGLDAWYYWVLAAAVLLTTSVFNAPEEPVATRSGLDTRTAG
jgi:hypothetical protein